MTVTCVPFVWRDRTIGQWPHLRILRQDATAPARMLRTYSTSYTKLVRPLAPARPSTQVRSRFVHHSWSFLRHKRRRSSLRHSNLACKRKSNVQLRPSTCCAGFLKQEYAYNGISCMIIQSVLRRSHGEEPTPRSSGRLSAGRYGWWKPPAQPDEEETRQGAFGRMGGLTLEAPKRGKAGGRSTRARSAKPAYPLMSQHRHRTDTHQRVLDPD